MMHSITRFTKVIITLVLFVLVTPLLPFKSMAQGNLLITPRRVAFDGSKRSEELNLANVGTDSATYVISFIQIRMKDDGTFEKITEPDSAQLFADKYLRFFPRTVTLAPNEAQTVKVQVIRTNEMLPGEYRSHLYFRAVPAEKPLGDKETAKDSSISVKIIPIFGISVPVIIRAGEVSSKVELSNVMFKVEGDTMPMLNMTFNRSGNMSVYGDVSVEHVSANGKVTKVGSIKGMAVYTPNTKRNVRLPLDRKISNADYKSGKLRINYLDQSFKPVTLAEQELVLR